jgi:peptidoglycan hydrolase-like protein with peptidoglycan-binding domain
MRLRGRDLQTGTTGDDVADLHGDLVRLGFPIPADERRERNFGPATARAVARFRESHGLPSTDLVDERIAEALTRAVAEIADGKRDGLVEGKVYLDQGLPARELSLRLYDRGFAGAAKLISETTTRDDGGYVMAYNRDGRTVNLEIRAVRPDGTEVSLTGTAYQAAEKERLNVVAPASQVAPMAAEYRRLLGDLRPHLGDAELAEAKENGDRADLTLLNQATGWDARLVALASSAAALSRSTRIDSPALYGMLRAGLPTDAAQLARVSPDTVHRALRRAAESGVVELSASDIKQATTAFRRFARDTRMAATAPGALSDQRDMLAAAGLTDADAERFDELYAAHRGSPDDLWRAAEQQKLPVDRLRVTGKLGYLTQNNAALSASLGKAAIETGDLGGVLVGEGLYRSDAWQTRLRRLAGDGDLAAVIPPQYTGETAEQRLASYADDLARKVRLSYPTQIVADLVAHDEMRLGDRHAHLKDDVTTVLSRASAIGYSIGRTPVTALVREHGDEIFADLPRDRVTETTEQLKALQRLHQISPSDDTMTKLAAAGFTSAHDVTGLPYAKFVDRYAELLGGKHIADLIYRRAQQITTVVYTFFGAAKELDAAPPVRVVSPPPEVREEAKNELIKHFPTMESLFGSLDYCECDHCRSVLGPAAYLVDLLHFLDPGELEWTGDLTRWRARHGGAPYPFANPQAWQDFQDAWQAEHPGEPLPETELTPFDVLTARRPDLPELELTCENTNTVLPYIDVVNEILEYYVANGRLDAGAARDNTVESSDDLLAEPQHVLREVYDTTLAQSRYPLTLPFDLWLEQVRRFFAHFETPLWSVLDALRPTDVLYPPAGPGTPRYGRAAAFVERLGLPPGEYDVLTATDPAASWHELYGYDGAATASAALTSAKTLSRRLGVTYPELIALLKTGFVNPELPTLAALYALDAEVADVLRYREHAGHAPLTADERTAFEAKLGPDGLAWVNAAYDDGRFARILVLADPNAGCGFDTTTLRYADGSAADAPAFLRLNCLTRLWRRLRWTIDDTDRALRTFLPPTPDPHTPAAIGPALASALLGLAHLEALTERFGGGAIRRRRLLALWADLDAPAYAELFLVRSTGNDDPIFDHPLGQYLSHLDGGEYKPFTFDPDQPEDPATGNVGLRNHVGAVQAAVKLSADDLTRILADLGTSLDAAPLDVATVSALHRYALLAKLLRMPVADLIALKALTGLDPFTPPADAPVTDAADDHPYRHTRRFVQIADELTASGLDVAELDYAVRHTFDPVGPHRTATQPPLPLIRTLAAEVARIRAEHTPPADALTFTDEQVAVKLALALPADVVDGFLGMWTGTVEYRAERAAAPADALVPADFTDEPEITVRYDDLRERQHLTYRGVLTDDRKAALIAAHPEPLFGALLDDVQAQPTGFFSRHLQRSIVGTEPAGFLEPGDFDTLFAPAPGGATDAELQERERQRRRTLADAFLPFLQERLIRRLVVERLADASGAPPAIVSALVTDPALLADRAWPAEPLLTAFARADVRGATVTTTASSADIEGYLEVTEPGAYRFFVSAANAGTTAELRLDHLADPLIRGTIAAAGGELDEFTELRAGAPYRLTLHAANTGGGAVTLAVQGERLPKGPLDRLVVYPESVVERFRRAYVLLGKVLRLATTLPLSEAELRHALTHPDDFAGLDLRWLPTGSADDDPTRVTSLTTQVLGLIRYARLRDDLDAEPADLVDLMAHARRSFPGGAVEADAIDEVLAELAARLGRITRREPAVVRAAAGALGIAASATAAADRLDVAVPGFAGEPGLRRIQTVLALATRVGTDPAALERWADPRPDFAVARDVRDTVKARYEPDAWRRVAQPIFDTLRQRRRDALVAYIMHTDGFDRLEQLFEFFLVDPGTEPVVRTSRLRLAISSVQLFVQRCLLNLEPKVHPSAINSEHWRWMKRYRVWEANRKIFLWPENWLEPEWRDDKTHLFTELEGALLESDLSADVAEDALFGYLRKLDELARLDIRSVYLEERDDAAANTLHVVGRTFNAPHKYFYRTYRHQMWTPWIPVTAEIEGDHLVTVVWRDRPHLFWVTFTEQADAEANSSRTPEDMGGLSNSTLMGDKYVEVQLHWTEYFQGAWTNRTSATAVNPLRVKVSRYFQPRYEFIHVTEETDGSVTIHLSNWLDKAFRVVSRNAPPQVRDAEYAPAPPFFVWYEGARYAGSEALWVYFEDKVTSTVSSEESTWTFQPLLGTTGEYQLTTPSAPLTRYAPAIAGLVSPFFFADERHTFYVEPTVTEKTIVEWNDWVLTPWFRLDVEDEATLDKIEIKPHVQLEFKPEALDPIGPVAKYRISTPQDWVTRPEAVVQFDGKVIGAGGGLDRDVTVADRGPLLSRVPAAAIER